MLHIGTLLNSILVQQRRGNLWKQAIIKNQFLYSEVYIQRRCLLQILKVNFNY